MNYTLTYYTLIERITNDLHTRFTLYTYFVMYYIMTVTNLYTYQATHGIPHDIEISLWF